MSATVNVHEAKTNFSRLLERAHAGEEIVVAKAGKPYARLVPLAGTAVAARAPGRFARLRGTVDDSALLAPLDADELDAWEGSRSNVL